MNLDRPNSYYDNGQILQKKEGWLAVLEERAASRWNLSERVWTRFQLRARELPKVIRLVSA